MSQFQTVTSLYGLSSTNAACLVDAKDHQSFLSQNLFSGLFIAAFEHELLNIIKGQGITHVVVAPVRQQRLWLGNWHPAKVLLAVLHKLQSHHNLRFLIVESRLKSNQRQSRLSALFRESRLHEMIQSDPSQIQCNLKIDLMTQKQLAKEPVGGVLFIDDVLTSGESAWRTYLGLKQWLENGKWHILTLFRTPRA